MYKSKRQKHMYSSPIFCIEEGNKGYGFFRTDLNAVSLFYLIYQTVLVSGVKWSDSVIHIYIYVYVYILFLSWFFTITVYYKISNIVPFAIYFFNQ